MAILTSAHISLSRVNDGKNGVSLTSIDVYYIQTSSTTPPAKPTNTDKKGWTTIAPTWVSGKYIWSCTETVLSNNSKTYSEPACITGQKGANGSQGAVGQGVSSITEEYYLSTSKTTQTGGSWGTTPPPWSNGKYMWTRSKIVYKNPTSTAYTTPVCDSSWEAINDVKIGGQNLILNTKGGYLFGVSMQYMAANETDFFTIGSEETDAYKFADTLEIDEYTLSFKVRDLAPTTKRMTIEILNKTNAVQKSFIKNIVDGYVELQFKTSADTSKIKIYCGVVGETNVNQGYVYNLKLEKGNKATAWSPAPQDFYEDVQNSISKIDQKADRINLIVRSDSNESNLELTDQAINAVAKEINLKGLVTFSGLDSEIKDKMDEPNRTIEGWKKPPVENANQTTINGGYIQANTIKIGQLDVENIFATGSSVMNTIDAREINADRITSGRIKTEYLDLYGLTVTNKETKKETMKIDPSGNVTIRGSFESYNYKKGENGWSIDSNGTAELNEVTVRGNVITSNGGICNDNQKIKEVRFWAGAEYDRREDAPFIVYSDGTVRSTKGLYGGIWTGDIKIGNISIVDPSDMQGNDAVFTIRNGQGFLKDRVRLTDTSDSFFNQNVHIGDLSGDKNISLIDSGIGYFKNSVRVGENITLNGSSLTFKNGSISEYDNSLLWMGNNIQIGKVTQKTNVETYGDHKVHGKVRIDEQLEFSDVVRVKLADGGLDIEIINEIRLEDLPVDNSATYLNIVE